MVIKKKISEYKVGSKFRDKWGVTRTIVSAKDDVYEMERDIPNGLPNATMKSEHITRYINLERWERL